MEQFSGSKESSKLVDQSSSSSQEISSRLSDTSIKDKEMRVKIRIKRIQYGDEYVDYLYASERDPYLEMDSSDEEGYKAENQKGEPQKSQTFRYPIFNEESLGIYSRYIQKDTNYFMAMHDKTRILPDLFDVNTGTVISLPMLKEIAKTLTTPPKIMEVNEERKVKVCGSIKNSYEAFLNFDPNTPTVIRNLIRLSVQDNPKLTPVKLEDIVPGVMYAGVDCKNNRYARLIFPEGYLKKTEAWRKHGERIRSEQEKLEEDADYTADERQMRVNRRKNEAKWESESFIFLSVDTGMACFRHVSKIFRLSDVCKELLDIPHQATKVLVTSLDHDPKYPPYALEDYYPGPTRVMAKRVQEPDGELPRVELVSHPMD